MQINSQKLEIIASFFWKISGINAIFIWNIFLNYKTMQISIWYAFHANKGKIWKKIKSNALHICDSSAHWSFQLFPIFYLTTNRGGVSHGIDSAEDPSTNPVDIGNGICSGCNARSLVLGDLQVVCEAVGARLSGSDGATGDATCTYRVSVK